MSDVIFASCDAEYYRKFGRAFVNSAVSNGNSVHVHIINRPEDLAVVDHPCVKHTFEYGAPASKEYYSVNRFLMAPRLLEEDAGGELRLLILDIDSLVRQKVVFPSAPIGLYLREPIGDTDWLVQASRVAAGCVLLDRRGLPFARRVAERIGQLPSEWFADQVALSEAYDEFKSRMEIADLSSGGRFMDWTFEPDSGVWTGKGPRKYLSEPYLKEFEYWTTVELS